jgi:hypothetical protein
LALSLPIFRREQRMVPLSESQRFIMRVRYEVNLPHKY